MLTTSELRIIIAKSVGNGFNAGDLRDDTLFPDAGIDSLDHATIVLGVQEEYGIEIPDDEFEECRSIESLTRIANRRIAEKETSKTAG